MLSRSVMCLMAVPIVLLVGAYRLRQHRPAGCVAAEVVLWAYAAAVLAVTMGPFLYDPAVIAARSAYEEGANNLIPLRTIVNYFWGGSSWAIVSQVLGNLFLLTPLGFLVPQLFSRVDSARKALAVGFTVSLSIELVQLLYSTILGFTYKKFDVDDLLLNTIGALIGYACWLGVRALFAPRTAKA